MSAQGCRDEVTSTMDACVCDLNMCVAYWLSQLSGAERKLALQFVYSQWGELISICLGLHIVCKLLIQMSDELCPRSKEEFILQDLWMNCSLYIIESQCFGL